MENLCLCYRKIKVIIIITTIILSSFTITNGIPVPAKSQVPSKQAVAASLLTLLKVSDTPMLASPSSSSKRISQDEQSDEPYSLPLSGGGLLDDFYDYYYDYDEDVEIIQNKKHGSKYS